MNVTYLQVGSHLLRYDPQPNTSEIIDSESRILRHVHREHSSTAPLNFFVLEPLSEGLQSHTLHHLTHHDLDKDTATRRCILLIDFDALEHDPGNRICGDQMSEETGDIT